MTKQKIMNEAIRLGMKINGGAVERCGHGHPTVFIYYSGHINVLEVQIYSDGWAPDEGVSADTSYYFSLDKDEDKLMQVLENLKEYAEKLTEKKKGK